jgi:hypothetical protein
VVQSRGTLAYSPLVVTIRMKYDDVTAPNQGDGFASFCVVFRMLVVLTRFSEGKNA